MKYEDDFDGLLNDALREVREAEPRMGLEGRVLAGVRTGAEERRFVWWKWAAVAAMVVLIVLGIAVRRGSKVDVVRKGPERVVVPEKKVEEAGKVEAPKVTREVKVRRVARARPRKKAEPVLVATTRLPFPAPSPLTEEEKALQRWASRKPDVLVKLNEVREETTEKPITISPIETAPIDGGEK
jgi:hypothetical protein